MRVAPHAVDSRSVSGDVVAFTFVMYGVAAFVVVSCFAYARTIQL